MQAIATEKGLHVPVSEGAQIAQVATNAIWIGRKLDLVAQLGVLVPVDLVTIGVAPW